jgi:hypothetical protein
VVIRSPNAPSGLQQWGRLNEIVIAAFRREHGRDPATKAEYRAYYRALYEEAVAAMEARSDVPEWLTTDDE